LISLPFPPPSLCIPPIFLFFRTRERFGSFPSHFLFFPSVLTQGPWIMGGCCFLFSPPSSSLSFFFPDNIVEGGRGVGVFVSFFFFLFPPLGSRRALPFLNGRFARWVHEGRSLVPFPSFFPPLPLFFFPYLILFFSGGT